MRLLQPRRRVVPRGCGGGPHRDQQAGDGESGQRATVALPRQRVEAHRPDDEGGRHACVTTAARGRDTVSTVSTRAAKGGGMAGSEREAKFKRGLNEEGG